MAMKENPFKNLDIDGKIAVYNQLFSMGANYNDSFKEKIELLHLICFLSSNMKIKFPEKFKTSIDVLKHLYGRDLTEDNGENHYLIALGIICDDLLYGVDEVPKPEGFTNASEICKRIKDLVDQWMPF